MTPRLLIIDNICTLISLRGKSPLRSVLLWANILHSLLISSQTCLLQDNAEVTPVKCFLWRLMEITPPVVSCLSFWTVKTPKSKHNLTQHNAKQPLNEIDSRVRKTQVWFHIALTSAGSPAISSRQAFGTRSSSTFPVTSASEETVKTNGEVQLLLLQDLLSLSAQICGFFFC